MDYKISIVMPAYNIEKHIKEMIESIIHQSYAKWELIIIDDGSGDDTGKICDAYSNEKIFVYHIKNRGQIGARIEGIKKCTGDYTLVVDADDYLKEDCLETLNTVLNQKEYDCVAYAVECCDEDLKYMSTTDAPVRIGELSQEEMIMWIIDEMNHCLYNKAVKTEICKKGVEDAMTERVLINGDLAIVIPVMCYVKTVYYIDRSLYKYRIFEKSISHNRKYQHIIDTDRVVSSVVKSLKKHRLFEGKIEKSVMFSYFSMIVCMMREINKKRFITKNEIIELHRSPFFRYSKKYETKELLGLVKLIELKAIRREGLGAVNGMNILLRADSFARYITGK